MNTDSNVPAHADEFAGKRVLVTGGTKGMGEAIAKRLARGGATVATVARSAAPAAPASDLFLQADLSTAEGTEKVVREVLDRLGGVDTLINNVGGSSSPGGGFAALTTMTGSSLSTATCFAPSASIARYCLGCWSEAPA